MGNNFKKILIMSRPPFHIVGILPFGLGAMMAYRLHGDFSWLIFIVSTLAVIAIMLSTYYNGEYYDIKEDRLSARMGKNPFSGGSQVIAQSQLPRTAARMASLLSIGFAATMGMVLQFVLETGVWTIPLGLAGILFGYFYSAPPFRWVSRGVGELMIGFCYGWLPINVSYYIQTQDFLPLASWISIPVGLSIINVILINEFPDYEPDRISGKKTLAVRIGKQNAAVLYLCIFVLTWLFFVVSFWKGAPLLSLYISIPFMLASLAAAGAVALKKYVKPQLLALICGLTILVNIGISLSYLIGFAAGGDWYL